MLRKPPDNRAVADIFYSLADFLDMDDVAFKPQSYRKAAYAVESLDQQVWEIYKTGGKKALEQIPGVGAGIAGKIEELLIKGKVMDYERLYKKMPIHLTELRRIEGIGPKTIKVLYKKLGVRDLASLKKAAASGQIKKLARFGAKSEEKILKGIDFFEVSHGRFFIGEVLPLARSLVKRMAAHKDIERIEYAGSIRRFEETVGDIDLLAVAKNSKPVMDFFTKFPEVRHIYAKGLTKTAVRLSNGIDVDLRVIPPESYGAALQYFTGSKDHNVILRKAAIAKGLKLNEYGLFRGKKQVAGETEESIYRALGFKTPIPELRQGRCELEKVWYDIIDVEDIKGDLQVQSDWTDGSNSLTEIRASARKLKHEYIAITDHTRSLAMTGGSDEAKLRRQMREIDRLNLHRSGVTLLKGAEVNIMKDGSLDIDDRTLELCDVVGAAIHSHFNLERQDQTERIIRAMENPHVDIIFHPTGRILGKRAPCALDMQKLFTAARRTGTILEIDAHPSRLDLNGEHIREGVEEKVSFSIDSDAHSIHELEYLEYGVGQARRAGLSKTSVVNTLPLKEFRRLFRSPKLKRFSL